jgi:hypothetical protein
MNTLNCFTCGKFISYEHLGTVDPVAYEPQYEYDQGHFNFIEWIHNHHLCLTPNNL